MKNKSQIIKNEKHYIKMKEKNLKSKSGITLVALVITVIVLLILAGTAIAMGLNQGELFSKTNDSVEKWNEGAKKEQQTVQETIQYLTPSMPTGIKKVAFYGNGNNSTLIVQATGGFAYKYRLAGETQWSETIPNGQDYEITGLVENQTYTVEAICVDFFGEEGTDIKSENIKVAYEGRIGEYVHYEVPLGIGPTTGEDAYSKDWGVFYEDEINGWTYLIAADFVPHTIGESENTIYETAIANAHLHSEETYLVYRSND
ncbi:MAG: hypothetical protein IKP28_05850 [Clostridia bacterium]|nr:hypothetical protein [Clostridia bacterium]